MCLINLLLEKIIYLDLILEGYSIILEHDENGSFGFGIKQFESAYVFSMHLSLLLRS